jgi:hypothetical protein
VPSARLRYAGETAFLVLVAVGLWLAGFEALVIVVVMAVALVLVALLERASSRASGSRVHEAEREEPSVEPPPVELEPLGKEVEERVAGEPEPEPLPAVSERSARALLASASPPMPPRQKTERKSPARRLRVERRPKAPQAVPPPEPEPVVTAPPREWNLWELERAVRDAGERQEEWGALLIHLREFANADGDLPLEFDTLVRESFGGVLAEPASAGAS